MNMGACAKIPPQHKTVVSDTEKLRKMKRPAFTFTPVRQCVSQCRPSSGTARARRQYLTIIKINFSRVIQWNRVLLKRREALGMVLAEVVEANYQRTGTPSPTKR